MPGYRKNNQILIVNKTKGTTLGYADMADSFLSRFRGLMLKKDLERGLIMRLPGGRSRRASGIHMFFMRIPLDIIFLDSQKRVVDLVSIDPWKTYTPQAPASYVIEMEKGVIGASKTQIGDELNFTCDQA
jgi:uncharacterized protein